MKDIECKIRIRTKDRVWIVADGEEKLQIIKLEDIADIDECGGLKYRDIRDERY